MSGHESDPVWSVYDRLRSAALNVKYFCRRLERYERIDFWTKFVLAINAPASAVSGWFLWSTAYGKPVWAVIGGAAAVIAVLTPLLGISKRIRDYENVIFGYKGLLFDLGQIRTMIEQDREYGEKLRLEFRQALNREKALITSSPEARDNPRIKAKCEEEVRREYPVSSFYIPGDKKNDNA